MIYLIDFIVIECLLLPAPIRMVNLPTTFGLAGHNERQMEFFQNVLTKPKPTANHKDLLERRMRIITI